MTRRLFIKTYGCQMNVYDSRRMTDALSPHGYEAVSEPDDADLIILNTCHIREKAAEKVYSDIGRLRPIKERRGKAGKRTLIAVAGCVAQAEGAEIIRRAPAVDMVFGPQTYHRLPDLLKQAHAAADAGRSPRVMDTEFPTEDKFDFLPEETGPAGASAFVTIQEGCDKFCTFCVVPYTRGTEFSRPVRSVVAEVERLVARGVLEVTLLGQNVNAYHGAGADGKPVTLGALIRRLARIEGLARIRYTTSHPRDVDDALIAVHGEVAACMPYLHLPVQSGSDRILAAMNRRHSADDYRAVVDRLRAARPDLALSSDFIVGFPGESDADFEATLRLVRDVEFAQSYSFKYSPRPGTPAAARPDQVAEEVKAERLARLQEELAGQQRRFNLATVGRVLPVLFERPGRKPAQLVGRSPYMQAVHVDFADAADKPLDASSTASYTDHMGRLYDVEITGSGPNSLEGRLAGAFGSRPAA